MSKYIILLERLEHLERKLNLMDLYVRDLLQTPTNRVELAEARKLVHLTGDFNDK